MGQTFTAEVALNNAVKVVVVSLKDGMGFINKVYEGLINAKVDPITDRIINCDVIRQNIVSAKQSLQKSEQDANAGLKVVDGNLEKLTQEEGVLNKDLSDTQQNLNNLKTQQNTNETLLRQSKSSLGVANSNHSSAQSTLRSQEQKKRDSAIVTGVGAGLLAIPGVGCMVGIPMIIGGAVNLDQAIRSVSTAEAQVKSSQTEVTRYSNKVSEYNSLIAQTEKNMGQKRDQINVINEKIKKLKVHRAAVSDVQEKVRKAVSILGLLSGKADVAESQTRRHIVLEPVMRVMEEVMKAAGGVTGSQLLNDAEIPKLLSVMNEHNKKLAALCA